MSTKQVGRIDGDLLAEIDKRADLLGQTRRVFVERALREKLDQPPAGTANAPPLHKE